MQSQQATTQQNQIFPNLVNTTLPISVTVQDNPLGQPESQNVDMSQRSQSEIEPLLDINGPSSSPSQPIQQNLVVEDLSPSLDKMEDKDNQKVAQILSPEELKAIEVQKAIEKEKKAKEKIENLQKMKPFFEDFYKADDFFVDIVPQKEKIESKIKVVSNRSWYIEGDYIFTIEPKDWDKEKDYYDSEKTQQSFELFFTTEIEGQQKTIENNLARTRTLHLKMNNIAPFESNFCLKIYTLTEMELVLSYNLPISHLNSDFLLQVYDKQYLAIICNDFFYYIQYRSLLRFYFDKENTEIVMFALVKLKDGAYKEHGKIQNVILFQSYNVFFEKGFIRNIDSENDIEVQPYTKGIEKLNISGIYIQPYRTVIIAANNCVYTYDYNEQQAVLKEKYSIRMLSSNYKSKHLLCNATEKHQFIKIVGCNQFEEIDYITQAQRNLDRQNIDYFDLTSDADDNTIASYQYHGYYWVFNYKDLDDQFFLRHIVTTQQTKILFHSGDQCLATSELDDNKYITNLTCKSLKYELPIKRFEDLKEATEITDFKESCNYKLRQIKHLQFYYSFYELGFKHQWLLGQIHSQQKAYNIGYEDNFKSILKINKEFRWNFVRNESHFEIQKYRIKDDQMLNPLNNVTESTVVFNEDILDLDPMRILLSETNFYFLAIDKDLKGVIFDLRSQVLIKHDDLSYIFQAIRMSEDQIVLVQLGNNQVVINKYLIKNNTLQKLESYNLTQNIKQFDITNLIFPKLMDINDLLKKEINLDSNVDFFYLNNEKNIVIFRLKIYDIGSQDFIIFNLETFDFVGSFSVNKQLCQINYIFFCVDDSQVYKSNIINQLINNYDQINPHKLHVKIDVVLNKYEFYDLDSQLIHFTSYEFKSIYQVQTNAQNRFKNLNDFTLNREIQNMSEIEIFNYNQGLQRSFIFTCNERSELVFEECYKRLLQINPAMSPQICAPHLENGKILQQTSHNILDFSVQKNQYRKIGLILNMILKFNNNLLYNNCIDLYIGFLLQKKVNLREYFESKLVYPKITSLAYPQYSKDHSVIYQSIIDITQFTYHSLWNDYKKYLGHSVNEDNDQPLVEVEYNLINIPTTMTSQDFIRNLIDSQNLEYYETEFIQTVLNFKWDTYTNKFFINQFYLYLLFLISYVTDLYFFTINAGADEEDSRSIVQQLVLKLTCVGYLLLQEYYEFKMLRRIGYVEYATDLWNIIDQAMAILYFVIVIIDIQEIAYNGIVILHSCMLILVFIKLCEILRVFQGFSYQVSMLKAVFMDLRYFIMLYGFVLIVYGLIFTLLRIKTSSDNIEYEGINYFGYFIMAFRASTGDFQIDNFYELEDAHIIFAWIVWISAVLFLNIILLNFIIAVISESYEKVMQKMVAESYRIKAQLIQERESYFNDEEFKNQEYFPSYIIFRRPVEDQIDDNQEWQGFVKDIKKAIYKTHTKSFNTEEQILHHVKAVELNVKTVDLNVKTVELTVKDLQTIIKNQDSIIKNHESQNKALQSTVTEMKTTINDIKTLLYSLFENSDDKQIKENIKEEIQEEEKQKIVKNE
eukprot:403343034